MDLDFFRPGTPPRMVELLGAMHVDDPDRWMPRRLILQNYWLFEEPEVFHFARGNLMLTGQNESGKSTVLVTAITLVLDMVLTPDRVDTMGSNDRSVRYYLVGRDDAPEDSAYYHRERTAYVALEFERGHSGAFQTIGIGLRSSRDWSDRKLEKWGFVMDGSRRVGLDFHLHDGAGRRPLRPGELRDRLGRAGQVFDDQRAYKHAVNQALFGFEKVEDYERFLEMLHVVRTPKLGEGLNPKKVEAYLKESLPPIHTSAIENASEVFSKLDTIEAELDRLREQLRVARELEPAQDEAVLAAARQAANVYRLSAQEHRGRKRAHEKLLAELESARAEVARQQARQEALAAERAERQGRFDILQEQYATHGAFNLEARLSAAQAEQAQASAALEALRKDRRNALAATDREQEALRATEGSWTGQRGRLREKLEVIAAAARQAFWPSLEQRAAAAGDTLEGLSVDGGGAIASELARSSLPSEAGQRQAVLRAIHSALDAVNAATARQEQARRAGEAARREYNHADERYRAAVREAESARTATGTAVAQWRSAVTEMHVTNAGLEAVLTELEAYQPAGGRPASLLSPLQAVHDHAAEGLRSLGHELEGRRHAVRSAADEVDARLRRLAAEPDVEPERTLSQAAARRLLGEHGIAHLPLFAACDLGTALGKDAALAARVEAALEDAGLLDALVVSTADAHRVSTLLDAHGLGDRWIRPGTEHEDTHAEGDGWLVPVAPRDGAAPEVGAADVRAALRALGLAGGDESVVDTAGGWRLGPLHGLAAAPAEARVRFLGETARREERLRRMDEARSRLAELREALAALGEEMEEVRGRERTLAAEWRALHELPQLQAVHDLLLVADREKRERDRRQATAELAAEAVENAAREVQQKTVALDRASDAAPYLKGRARAEVDAVAGALRDVLSLARAVGEDIDRMDDIRRQHAARTESLRALRMQAEELAPRIASADTRLQTLDAQIRTLQEQLERENVGREELAAEIRGLVARLEEIREQNDATLKVINIRVGTINTLAEQEPDYADQLRKAQVALHADEAAFRARLDAYPTLAEYLAAWRESGRTDRAMQLILHDVDHAAVDEAARQARDALQGAFLRASGTFEEMSPSLEGDVVRFTHEFGAMRLDELHRALEEQQARNETLLEEEDRRLIEQLLLRDVVDAIRDAIRNTEHWVHDINRILGQMQLFKGGIMRLHWEPRTREAADAFDPRRLSELLQQRGVALTETRREELLDIFKDMVSDVRRRNRDRKLLEDYRTALLRMVDYTQWFTLTVQRKDDSGRWTPLTRRLYGQGSGGRRTLDLLLPLIAAVSARLASADRAAPRLIGFDEAFAGVDDRNAAEIYGLLTRLGFCWIMATEKTTGLGSQVRGSATYEMLTDGVTVAPTLGLWDGERRYEFVGDELITVHSSRRAAEA